MASEGVNNPPPPYENPLVAQSIAYVVDDEEQEFFDASEVPPLQVGQEYFATRNSVGPSIKEAPSSQARVCVNDHPFIAEPATPAGLIISDCVESDIATPGAWVPLPQGWRTDQCSRLVAALVIIAISLLIVFSFLSSSDAPKVQEEGNTTAGGFWRGGPFLLEQYASEAKPDSRQQYQGLSVVLVSAFWELPSSKHSVEDYKEWIRRFFATVNCNSVVMYTEPRWQAFFEELCPPPTTTTEEEAWGIPGKLTILTHWPNPWSVPCNHGRYRSYLNQWSKDYEKDIHNPNIYATWRAKPCLVNHTAQLYPPQHGPRSAIYFWGDAGMFRSRSNITHWPSIQRAADVFSSIGDGEILLSGFRRFEKTQRGYKEELGPVTGNHICGCFFGGYFRAVTEYAMRYTAMHDSFEKAGHFVGKDQDVMNALALSRPSDTWVIPGEETRNCIPGGDWFTSQLFFAAPNPGGSCDSSVMKAVKVSEYYKS